MTKAEEIPHLIWIEAVLGIATFLVGLTFPRAPALAPSVSAGEERLGFWAGVRLLLRRPAFLGLAALWAVSSGVGWGWGTLLDVRARLQLLLCVLHPARKAQIVCCPQVFLQDSLTQVQIGWIGFGGNLAGAVGGVMAGMLIDRFDQSLCA